MNLTCINPIFFALLSDNNSIKITSWENFPRRYIRWRSFAFFNSDFARMNLETLLPPWTELVSLEWTEVQFNQVPSGIWTQFSSSSKNWGELRELSSFELSSLQPCTLNIGCFRRHSISTPRVPWIWSEMAASTRTRRMKRHLLLGRSIPASQSTSVTSVTTGLSGKSSLNEISYLVQNYVFHQPKLFSVCRFCTNFCLLHPSQICQGPGQAPTCPHRGAAVLVFTLREEVPQLEQPLQGDPNDCCKARLGVLPFLLLLRGSLHAGCQRFNKTGNHPQPT